MILLSFDVEEFDLFPEYGQVLQIKDQLNVATHGVLSILELLEKHEIKATFYCTAVYALNKPEIIVKIAEQGHEIASHGYDRSSFKEEDIFESKRILEEISGLKISGFRMPKMAEGNTDAIEAAGYVYNSSVNPTWVPGRYNNFRSKRTYSKKSGLIEFPISVSPIIRFPLFWLSFHILPLSVIKFLSKWVYGSDGYIHLCFHTWEFADLKSNPNFKVPKYLSKTSGALFLAILDEYIQWCLNTHQQFVKTEDLVEEILDKEFFERKISA